MNNENRIVLEEQKKDYIFSKSKSNLNINFNRIAFIFFVFFIISVIFSIHLIHLGSRNLKNTIKIDPVESNKEFYRADIVDRNNEYLSKTISSIDIGISPSQIIDEKKLILNLRYIFPDKDYSEIKKELIRENFFILKKKYQMKIMKN